MRIRIAFLLIFLVAAFSVSNAEAAPASALYSAKVSNNADHTLSVTATYYLQQANISMVNITAAISAQAYYLFDKMPYDTANWTATYSIVNLKAMDLTTNLSSEFPGPYAQAVVDQLVFVITQSDGQAPHIALDSSIVSCSQHADCSSCSGELQCIWCEGTKTCDRGEFYGPSGICDDWRWKQCSVSGKWLFVAQLGFALLLLLCLFICICRCCCCQSKKKAKRPTRLRALAEERKGLINGNSDEDDEEAPASHTPRTDIRREELRAKWGIKPK